MKKMLPESELARDERFVRTKIEDRIFDPRGAEDRRSATPARPRWRTDRPAAGRAFPFADARHLRRRDPGARRRRPHLLTTSTTTRRRSSSSSTWPASAGTSRATARSRSSSATTWAPRSASTPSRTFLFAAACNPDPVLRLCGVNRALEGLAIDVFSSMKEFGNESGDPVLEFCEDWMLADEVTHVKMGSDWLRRLTESDPERRERALEFQRTVDAIFNLGGFRGEDDENPIQLARRLPRARRVHRRGERLARRARPRVDRAGAARWPRWRPPRSTRQSSGEPRPS